MSRCAVLVDFGSTYTKLAAVDLKEGKLLGWQQVPSTVETDVTIGLTQALDCLRVKVAPRLDVACRLACSSAAGGLRMVTIGLVPELTAQAAAQAALGAGAKPVGNFAYKLTPDDLSRIRQQRPDIVLLAGGTDGGNTEIITRNAALLASVGIQCPVIVAGNRVAAPDAAAHLRAAGLQVTVTENVLPALGTLNIEPARSAIRQVFIDRIVAAKGIDRASSLVDVLMPTPSAVLAGVRLLAEGGRDWPGLGELLAVDVGGATTDVYSAAAGTPPLPDVVYRGLPEPYLKRTVEGDLGLRHNAAVLMKAAGAEALARDAGEMPEAVTTWVGRVTARVETLPKTATEANVDLALARTAVRTAAARHAGRQEVIYTPLGRAVVQFGKDLRSIGAIVGTGGVIAASPRPAAILRAATDAAGSGVLLPVAPAIYVDRHYVLFAAGLLAERFPDAACAIVRRSLERVAAEALANR